MRIERSKQHSTPNATAVSRTMAGALRACERALAQDRSERLDALRKPLRLLCICAVRANVPPERILIHLKRMLADSARTLKLSTAQAERVRLRAVALAIETYFSRGIEG